MTSHYGYEFPTDMYQALTLGLGRLSNYFFRPS